MNIYPTLSSMDTPEIFGLIFGIGLPLVVIVLMILAFRKPLKARWNPERKYILTHGKPAQARILSVGHAREGSTTTINGRVYLKIELEVQDSSAPYLTSIDALLSDAESALLFEGRLIPVKVHPDNYLKVAVDWNNISFI
jgi:hypothetical protein